jgi:hypothetical protein
MPPGLSLYAALAWLEDNAEEGGNYTITLKSDEYIEPQTLSYDGKNVNITLNGETRRKWITLDSRGSLFTVEAGVTLTLDANVTLQGRDDNRFPLVIVNSGGTLVLKDGAKVVDNINESSSSSSRGGGVFVDGGTFRMEDGEISGNARSSSSSSAYGGGVYVRNGGTFTMSGGAIIGNTASSSEFSSGGGVFVVGEGTLFTMSGGTISDNTAGDGGEGTFTMSNEILISVISNNTASSGGGVSVSNGMFTMNDGIIIGNTASSNGGGVLVYANGTFMMNGGTVSSNRAERGGGVLVSNMDTFTMSGGTITGNTAGDGGGVYVIRGNYTGAFIKQSGGIIYGSDTSGSSKNTATSGNGHAVYVDTSPIKKRNTTAGVGVTLNSEVSGSAGGWE